MKTQWLLEEATFEEELPQMIAALNELNIPYKLLGNYDYDEDFKPSFLDWFDDEACVLFHGSIDTANIIKHRAQWLPGVYLDWPNFKCSHYYNFFGNELLNSNYLMLPFGELNRRKDFLFQTFGQNDKVFIRPDNGNKIFTGKAVSVDSWKEDVRRFGFYDVEPESIVIVAPAQEIVDEWRCVIAKNFYLTGCCYTSPEKGIPNEIVSYVERILKNNPYSPHPLWILDVCQTSTGEIKVLEVGSFSISGFYGCDALQIAEEASNIADTEWNYYR